MPYPIEDKLVIACASSALFDLTESDTVFRERGEAEYRAYPRQHLDDTLPKGVALPFIRRFLQHNNRMPAQQPVEVVLLSRNDPETGLRGFRSPSVLLQGPCCRRRSTIAKKIGNCAWRSISTACWPTTKRETCSSVAICKRFTGTKYVTRTSRTIRGR